MVDLIRIVRDGREYHEQCQPFFGSPLVASLTSIARPKLTAASLRVYCTIITLTNNLGAWLFFADVLRSAMDGGASFAIRECSDRSGNVLFQQFDDFCKRPGLGTVLFDVLHAANKSSNHGVDSNGCQKKGSGVTTVDQSPLVALLLVNDKEKVANVL